MLTPLQDQSIKAIVNVFETGTVLGKYGEVTLLSGDTGGLTYGRSQTTLNSGGLHQLILRYTQAASAVFAAEFQTYLNPLEARQQSLEADAYFKNLLRAAADDTVMRETQDSFFDEEYYAPSGRTARANGIQSALGRAVVYDSRVHGSWGLIRKRTNQNHGRLAELGEQKWIEAYVRERREWLANNRRTVLRDTVYRMDSFLTLIEGDLWSLELPFLVRDEEVTAGTLQSEPVDAYSHPEIRTRNLEVTRPRLQRGLDVRTVQLALSKPGNDFAVKADGVFGPASRGIVREFQRRTQLEPTGVVAQAEFDALGL